MNNRRFTVEEIDNGWLVKISEAGSDRLVGRYAFHNVETLFAWLNAELQKRQIP